MKFFVGFPLIFIFLAAVGCDVQSGITKRSVEKYAASPTPVDAVEVEKIDPSDVITVNTSVSGPTISIQKDAQKTSIECKEFNNVTINVSGGQITIRGVCSRVMVNGDNNQIEAHAFAETLLNGHENQIQYSKYVNGRKPQITDNGGGNVVAKAEN